MLALLGAFLSAIPSASFAEGAHCAPASGTAESWTRWECILEVEGPFSGRSGYAATQLKVSFSATGEYTRTTYAFWDGGSGSPNDRARFKIRFAFPTSRTSPKVWSWSTSCDTPLTCGPTLTSPSLITSGTVSVTTYSGTNPIYLKGFLGRTSYQWFDGGSWRYWNTLGYNWTGGGQFVWIGDSAWAAPMKATDGDWVSYMNDRKEGSATANKGVTVVQIGPASKWAGSADAENNSPFATIPNCTPSDSIEPSNCSVPVPAFWQNFEDKIQTANERGIHVFLAGVMEPRSDHPGTTGPEDFPLAEEAVTFSRWLAARLSGNFVIFSPGFDAPKITKGGVLLQRASGQEVDRIDPRHMITNHWGTVEVGVMDDLQADAWLDFQTFQSGHNQKTNPPNTPQEQLQELTRRAREVAWQMSGTSDPNATPSLPPVASPRKAAVNGEAIYDQGGTPNSHFGSYRARQAGYLSWLSGAFGYSFGIGGIWDWGLCGTSGTVTPRLSPS